MIHLDETYLIDGIVAEHPNEITDDDAHKLLAAVPANLFVAWNNAKTHEQSVKAADLIIAAAINGLK